MKREAAESEPDEYFEIFNSLVQVAKPMIVESKRVVPVA